MKEKLTVSQLKKPIEIKANLLGKNLTFESTWGIFSPTAIDPGTEVLMKYLPEISADAAILDIGCGYGPIGITLAKQSSTRMVHMVDTNFVAVEFANRNIKKNKTHNAVAYLSNGLAEVADDMMFDVIITNLPAKVGNEMYRIMFHDMFKKLKPGGTAYFVTIAGLKDYMKRNLRDTFGNFDKIKQSGTYMVSSAFKME